MSAVEIILMLICGLFFLATAVAEKYFRVKMRSAARSEKKENGESNAQDIARNKSMRTAFSLLSAVFAALIFVILIISGAGHAVQLAAVLVMLFVLLV